VQEVPIGVLVMAYGTPKSLDEVEPYYTHIRRGRAPTPELLRELIGRYQAIGGVSPLNEITRAQASGIEERLNASGKAKYRVYLGMKHAQPFIADAVVQMAADGIQHAVTLVLAPHYSTMSVASYQTAATTAAADTNQPILHQINSWHTDPGLIDLLSDRVRAACRRLTDALPSDESVGVTETSYTNARRSIHVVFTAHSLPERILAQNDPYPQQLRETGEAVANQLDLDDFSFGWQSAGRTDEKWLGPDILDVLRQLAAQGKRNVVICPAGFVSDHLEVLYDVDIECQALAKELGIRLERTASLNAEPRFLDTLAKIVRDQATAALSMPL